MNDFTLYKKRVQIYTKFPNIRQFALNGCNKL